MRAEGAGGAVGDRCYCDGAGLNADDSSVRRSPRSLSS